MPQFEHPYESRLRDEIAMRAAQGFVSCQDFMNEQCSHGSKEQAMENVARWSYMLADKMLEERRKPRI